MADPQIPAIVETIAFAWACEPGRFASGTRRTGIHLSVLQGDNSASHEASAAAAVEYHTLCFPLRSYASEVVVDGRWSSASTVRAGELCLVAAQRQPWGVNFGPWRSLHVYLPVGIVTDLLEAEEIDAGGANVDFGEPSGFRDPGVERLCLALLDEMNTDRPLSRLRLDCLGQDLAIHLLRARVPHLRGPGPSTQRPLGGLAPWQLKRARDAIADHRSVGLAELAREAGCSTTHFSRAFKRSTGFSLSAWRQQQRLQQAEALLADPNLTLAEVALAVGFSAQSHFTSAFRRITGMTPGAWRKERFR